MPKQLAATLDRVEDRVGKVTDQLMAVERHMHDKYPVNPSCPMGSTDFGTKTDLDNCIGAISHITWDLCRTLYYTSTLDDEPAAKQWLVVLGNIKPHPIPKDVTDPDTVLAAETLAYAHQRIASLLADLRGVEG
ncbi:hypothetical protein GS624_03610 [Ruegeria sp. HKCCD5849]|uniref:hypothetical protein n=1 Tax=unclassified Ruegeria TaxID=2625375 RepID=UPI001491FDE9|nr:MULTISPECIES: hypothetical protein [unclassified Ruegeria]NOD46391.1 hypothetical protein [Ruegeria sp. HKCCD5849]NOD50309.1 hypothetical protein [Ruegeria sp. HKCCD5851]